jgi:quercetin dioxygenase-like cupin family protein
MNPLKKDQTIKPMLFLPVVFGALVYLGLAAEPRPSGVIHIDRQKVTAAFAKGGALLATNNFKIQAGRREITGEVEIHDADTDIFYIMEGSATFVTGGHAVQPRTIDPGETRAKEITGGENHQLVKGDVIVIPAGVPHWFEEVRGPLLYYVVKVSK